MLWASSHVRTVAEAVPWVIWGKGAVILLLFWLAIIDVFIAHRLRVIRMWVTIAALLSSASGVALGGLIMTVELFHWWDAPGWWWLPPLGIHCVASGTAKLGLFTRVVMPVTATVEAIREADG